MAAAPAAARRRAGAQADAPTGLVGRAVRRLCSTAALLGVIQGLTEFLPVSSTAHLLIGARLLRFDDPGGVFTVMIQLGSILAVMWLYRAEDRPRAARAAVRSRRRVISR